MQTLLLVCAGLRVTHASQTARLLPAICFPACSLKIIVFSTEQTTDWHLLGAAAPFWANINAAYQRAGLLVFTSACLHRPAADGGSSPLSPVVSGSQRQIPPCLSAQSAGQDRGQLETWQRERLNIKKGAAFLLTSFRNLFSLVINPRDSCVSERKTHKMTRMSPRPRLQNEFLHQLGPICRIPLCKLCHYGSWRCDECLL